MGWQLSAQSMALPGQFLSLALSGLYVLSNSEIFLLLKRLFVFISCARMCVHHMDVMSTEPRGVGSPGTGAIEGSEPSFGCWGLSLDPPQDQAALLTASHLSSPKIARVFKRFYFIVVLSCP